MEYTLRNLCADDIFPMFNIISKIGISEFKGCFSSDEVKSAIASAKKAGKKIDVESMGIGIAFDIADIILRNMSKCKADIYQFLSGLSGIADIGKLPLNVFFNMIKDVVRKEEFTDFFQAVTKLLN